LLDARSLGAPVATLRAPGFRAGAPPCTAALGPDAKHAAAGSADGTVCVWEVEGAGGRVVRTLGTGGGAAPTAVAWSPQGATLAVADRGGGVSPWAPAVDGGGGGARGAGGGGC